MKVNPHKLTEVNSLLVGWGQSLAHVQYRPLLVRPGEVLTSCEGLCLANGQLHIVFSVFLSFALSVIYLWVGNSVGGE